MGEIHLIEMIKNMIRFGNSLRQNNRKIKIRCGNSFGWNNIKSESDGEIHLVEITR